MYVVDEFSVHEFATYSIWNEQTGTVLEGKGGYGTTTSSSILLRANNIRINTGR